MLDRVEQGPVSRIKQQNYHNNPLWMYITLILISVILKLSLQYVFTLVGWGWVHVQNLSLNNPKK